MDVFFCCPTALRLPLWRSKVEPFGGEDKLSEFPANRGEYTASERIYKRVRLQNLTDCVVANNTLHKGGTGGLIDDRGGHENTVIENNVGRASPAL